MHIHIYSYICIYICLWVVPYRTWLEKFSKSLSVSSLDTVVAKGANARTWLVQRDNGAKARTDDAESRRESMSFMVTVDMLHSVDRNVRNYVLQFAVPSFVWSIVRSMDSIYWNIHTSYGSVVPTYLLRAKWTKAVSSRLTYSSRLVPGVKIQFAI